MSARPHLLLESEARQLLCPIVQRLEHCVARECMAWREIEASSSATGKREVVGYCAMMWTPPQVQESATASMLATLLHSAGLVKSDS